MVRALAMMEDQVLWGLMRLLRWHLRHAVADVVTDDVAHEE